MIDTAHGAAAIRVHTCYIYSWIGPFICAMGWSYDGPLPLFEMHRRAERACGLTEAIRSIISTTEEGLMRTILSV